MGLPTLSEVQEEKLETLASEIRAYLEEQEEILTDPERSPYAEDLWQWQEKDYDEILENAIEAVADELDEAKETIRRALKVKYGDSKKAVKDFYDRFVEMECSYDHRAVRHSIDSINMSEHTEQVEDEIRVQVDALSKDEKAVLADMLGSAMYKPADHTAIISLSSCFMHAVLAADRVAAEIVSIVENINDGGDGAERPRINRAALDNVGNTNGRDVKCQKCGEPWENYGIVHDFTQRELDRFVILKPQFDDPAGERSRIAALSGCPACEDKD